MSVGRHAGLLAAGVLALACVATNVRAEGLPDTAELAPPATVIAAPPAVGPLAAGWGWAMKEASRRASPGFWVGYSLRRLMGRNQFIGGFSGGGRNRQSLYETVTGERPPAVLAAGQAEGKIWKPVAVLFRFDAGTGAAPRLQRVEISTMDWAFDLRGLPLLWLGEADEAESIALLQARFNEPNAPKLREEILEAVTLHEDSEPVVAFLQDALAKDASESVRAEAASALGEQGGDRALAGVLAAAKNDASRRVRVEAVEAIGRMGLPGVAEALEDLARKSADLEVRKQALEAIARAAPADRAAAVFQAVLFEDTYQELQEEALDGLEHLPPSVAEPVLKKIAQKHRSRELRQQALERLAATAEPGQAAALLEKVAFEDTYPDLQEAAVEALGDLPAGQALPALQHVAEKHGNAEIREKALKRIVEQAPPEQAAETLEQAAMQDASADVQEAAAETLSELPAAIALPVARRLAAGHPVPDVRVRALKLIAERAEPAEAVAELERAARQDANEDVREEAVDALGKLPIEQGMPALEALVRSTLPADLREHAMASLAKHGIPEKVAAVFEDLAFQDRISDIQEEAIDALSDLPPDVALPPLIRIAQTHPVADRRREAVERLGKIPDPRARKIVRDARLKEESDDH
jgi:HEAT repeat protein